MTTGRVMPVRVRSRIGGHEVGAREGQPRSRRLASGWPRRASTLVGELEHVVAHGHDEAVGRDLMRPHAAGAAWSQ